MIRMYFYLMILFLLLLSVQPIFGMQQSNLDGEGRALHGYDPVSYYMAKPVKGDKDISYEDEYGKYLFASQENREAFINNREKYRFAYGGYCAWAMLEGEKVDVDPERFKVVEGVVYLFYNTFFTDTLDKWNELAESESEKELIHRADGWWMKINMQ